MLKSLAQVTAAAAARFGSKPALIFEGRWFSFAEIDALACRLANALKAMGIKPGDRVTLYSGNCWEWIVSYYGILKMGAVVNPLNVMLTPTEVGEFGIICNEFCGIGHHQMTGKVYVVQKKADAKPRMAEGEKRQ